MSVNVKRLLLPNAELVRFEQGEAVSLPAVQDALSALWRQASEQVLEQRDAALTRACLWNLIAYHTAPQRHLGAPDELPHRVEALLQRATVSMPARVLHLEEWSREAAPAENLEVEARVGASCLHAADGPSLLCSEQVNLAGYGPSGHSHFPAVVRALLEPDLPVALLLLDDVPRFTDQMAQLLELSDRMIVDSQHTTDPVSLLAMHKQQQTTPGKVTDLGWLRLNPLRNLVADFFDPPGRAEQLQQIERIFIETSPEGRNTGLLLLGWLLSRSGFAGVKGAGGADAPDAHGWQAQRARGKAVPVQLQVREGYGGLDGVFCIRIEAAGDTFTLTDVDPEHMSMMGPDHHVSSVPLREKDEPDLLVEALGVKLHDPVYAEALALAAALVESQQWKL